MRVTLATRELVVTTVGGALRVAVKKDTKEMASIAVSYATADINYLIVQSVVCTYYLIMSWHLSL